MAPYTQEKKAPKKEPGAKPKARSSEQLALRHQPDLMDDSQLPKSKVAMPVSPDPFQFCLLLYEPMT